MVPRPRAQWLQLWASMYQVKRVTGVVTSFVGTLCALRRLVATASALGVGQVSLQYSVRGERVRPRCDGRGAKRSTGHARRGFADVLKSPRLNPKKLPANPPAKARRALFALQRIRSLYAIERRIRDEPPDEHRRVRQTESVPVFDALRAWLDDTLAKVPPSTPLGKATSYLHNQWGALVRFCDDGPYAIDTDPIENAIRPFVVGRRNWLFADTVAGTHASARLYPIVA